MKSAMDYFEEMSCGKQTASHWIYVIEKAQREAYNHAIQDASEKLYAASPIDEMDRVHHYRLTKGILGLKKI